MLNAISLQTHAVVVSISSSNTVSDQLGCLTALLNEKVWLKGQKTNRCKKTCGQTKGSRRGYFVGSLNPAK